PLVCSVIDGQCRDQCETSVDCPMRQVCTVTSHLCADPSVDPNYDPVTMELKPTAGMVKVDAGGSDGGGAGGTDGGAGGANGGGVGGGPGSGGAPDGGGRAGSGGSVTGTGGG